MKILHTLKFIKRKGKHKYRADFIIELKLFIFKLLVNLILFFIEFYSYFSSKKDFRKYEFGFVFKSTYYLLDNAGIFSIASKIATDLMKIETPITRVSLRYGGILQKNLFFEDPWPRYFGVKSIDLRINVIQNRKDDLLPVDWWLQKYTDLPIHELFLAISEKFYVSKEVCKIRERLKNKYDIDIDKTIGVHYRGTDKAKEIQVSSVNNFIAEIDKQLLRFPDYRVLLQTDDLCVFEDLNTRFHGKIFSFSEIRPSKSGIGSHNRFRRNSISFTQNYLASLLILCEAKVLITHTGNGALWEFILRNEFKQDGIKDIFQI